MEQERKNFIYGIDDEEEYHSKGLCRNGVDEKVANKIFDEMIDFASYAFNKSPCRCLWWWPIRLYGLCYYPVEFMAEF